MAFEDEVAAVLDLGDGVEARQVHLAALLLGELWPQDQGPIIELFADDLRAQPVGGSLKGGGIIHGEEGLSSLRKPTFSRVSSCSMKEWPLR